MTVLAEQAAQIWTQLAAWLSTPQTLFWASWLACGLVLAASGWSAWRLVRRVRSFTPAGVVENVPGARPKRPAAIERRIERARTYANSTLRLLLRQTALLVLTGMVVPGAVLATIASHQDWFLPAPPALVDDGLTNGHVARPQEHPPATDEILVFVADQALRGALSDTFEVFGLSLSRVTNNPENLVFSALVLGYRLLCALAAAAVIYVAAATLRARPHMRAHIAALESQLAAARA